MPTLNRRRFLTALGAGAATLPLISLPAYGAANSGNILVLVELSGGNDALRRWLMGWPLGRHRTAAPVFVLGGRVAGGFSGARVSLDRLMDGALVHTTHYRHVYAAILRDLWQVSVPDFSGGDLRILA